MKYKKGTFVVVPNIEALDGIEVGCQALFVWICKYADEDGVCFPSRKKIAKHLGCAVRTVDRYIEILESAGILTKTVRRKEGSKENMSNLYQIEIVQNLLDPLADSDTTPLAENSTVTIPSINSNQLTQVLTSGQLPPNRGKTYILRLVSIYNDLFRNLYGFAPTVNIPRLGKSLKELLQTKTELQVAAMMITFFNWAGMTGDDNFQRQKLMDSGHNPSWFFSTVNQYEGYLRNVFGLDLDNEEAVREFVGKNMLAIKEN